MENGHFYVCFQKWCPSLQNIKAKEQRNEPKCHMPIIYLNQRQNHEFWCLPAHIFQRSVELNPCSCSGQNWSIQAAYKEKITLYQLQLTISSMVHEHICFLDCIGLFEEVPFHQILALHTCHFQSYHWPPNASPTGWWIYLQPRLTDKPTCPIP